MTTPLAQEIERTKATLREMEERLAQRNNPIGWAEVRDRFERLEADVMRLAELVDRLNKFASECNGHLARTCHVPERIPL